MVETNKTGRITGLPVKKPLSAVQYNENMVLVDKEICRRISIILLVKLESGKKKCFYLTHFAPRNN